MAVGPGWHVDGVDAARFKRLLYMPAAGAFVGVFEDDNISTPKLYYRQLATRRWRRFPSLGRNRFCSYDPVIAASAPFVFLNVLVWSTPERRAARWSHLARFNPATTQLTRVLDETTARFPKGVDRPGISRLLGASPRGDVLYATASLIRYADTGEVPYFAVRIALRTGVVTPVALLRNTAF
jgi:hypothetical protein